MTTKRLTLLLAVLLGGLSTVLLLPKQLAYQPVGIELTLPEYSGEWYGQSVKVSDREIAILGPDTEFSRKTYTNGRGDEIQVSIVLSGQDMNTSIHRPERCLPAQGWTIADKHAIQIPVAGLGVVPVTCLSNVRSVPSDDKPLSVHNVSYYWFAGHTDLTASHLDRTMIDIRDRILHGYNQRWAYITVSAVVTDNLKKFGRSEAETSRLIEDFIKRLVPVLHKDSLKQA
ncbi:MAG: exosortase C-terminal domain/associated protein EpsI [Chthoniobacteraceae bacterium]